MGDKFKTFWLGIFILAAIAVAAWLILFLNPSVGDGKQVVRIRFTNIEQVSVGTRVLYAGKPVGEVVRIEEIFDARDLPAAPDGELYVYELVLRVDSKVKIFNYDEIVFSTTGLLGEKSIAIIPKAAPPGQPPAHVVTDQVLFARSADKIDELLDQVSQFGEIDIPGMNQTLNAIGQTANELTTFLGHANEIGILTTLSTTAQSLKKLSDQALDQKIMERLGQSVDRIHDLTIKVTNSEGTLGKLLNSDAFYLQIEATMCRLTQVLDDITNFGLLFQYSKGWKRQRRCRRWQCEQMCTPAQFSNYTSEQIEQITATLHTLNTSEDCEEFATCLRALMNKVECLEQNVQIFNQMQFGLVQN